MSEELERKYLAVIQESLMEKLELQKKIDELEEKIFKIEHPSELEHYRKNGRSVIIKERFDMFNKPKETDLPDINLSSMIPKNDNTKVSENTNGIFSRNLDIALDDFKYNENTKESNILDEDKKKVLLDYIDKKIAYYSESDLKSISECMFHRSFEKELQKIRALLLYDNSSPWFDYHFS